MKTQRFVGSMGQLQTFGQHLAEILWHVMAKTGKGYRMYSLKRAGRGDDRRDDKLPPVSKLQRAARDGRLGMGQPR